jgi:hypothetical protein
MNKIKKIVVINILIFGGIFLILPLAKARDLSQNLSGRILLQVQQHGEAWYVYPVNHQRYYLGRASDAFQIMRNLGLGISNKDLAKIPTINDDQSNSWDLALTKRNAGKILLQVESHGEAWYINPVNNKRYYLGRPDDAYQIMRDLGLGITDQDLATIPTSSASLPSNITGPTGCTYHNPDCDTYHLCVNNVCQLRNGCIYNNPACGEGYECVNNACQAKTGCLYENPACDVNHQCVNNTCVLKSGCTYNNPACGTGYTCLNNLCQLSNNNNDFSDDGCVYDNPPCGSNFDCINNVCVLKTGCLYDNPTCNTNYDCLDNTCVLKAGCAYNNPACGPGYACFGNSYLAI